MTQSSKTVAQKAWHTIDKVMGTFETVMTFNGEQSGFCVLPSGRLMAPGPAIKRFEKIERAAAQARQALAKEPSDEPTPEQVARAKWHHMLALIHGFNAMATMAITLGEKAYYRLLRDDAERRFEEMGGKINRIEEHKPILVIPGAVPEIRFDARDIELMRECVARYDAASEDRSETDLPGEERR